MDLKKFYITFLASFFLAIQISFGNNAVIDSLPSVFMIGEHELEYEGMVVDCPHMLLAVCEDSMDEAYKEWLLMLKDIEDYAVEEEFEIRGIKIWLNVLWNPNGTIKHLVFYPKPNSRNMDFEELRQFFIKFVGQYKFKKSFETCFSHYGSAKFPSFAELYIKNKN